MMALASTTLFDGAGRGTMASSDASRSSPAPFQNDHEQWDVTDNSARPIFHGRFNGLFNTKIGGRSSPCRRPAEFSLTVGLNCPVERFNSARGALYSVALGGSRRLQPQTLPNQHVLQTLADRLELHVCRLPSSHRPRWIDPNENGLTNAKASFASGANSDD